MFISIVLFTLNVLLVLIWNLSKSLISVFPLLGCNWTTNTKLILLISLLLSYMQAINSNQSNMLILQDCCTDKSCSLVIYAPVDVGAMGTVLNGGDPDVVLLLPSGFAILPDGNPAASSSSSQHHSLFNNKTVTPSPNSNNSTNMTSTSSGSLLTVAFQILVDHVPTAKLSLESVATVNNLISSTVIRIKGALSCDSLS